MFQSNYLHGSDTFSPRNYAITKLLETKTNVIKVVKKTMFEVHILPENLPLNSLKRGENT